MPLSGIIGDKLWILSDLMYSGTPRVMNKSLSVTITSFAVILRLMRIYRLSPVYSSKKFSIRIFLPSLVLSTTKSCVIHDLCLQDKEECTIHHSTTNAVVLAVYVALSSLLSAITVQHAYGSRAILYCAALP